MAPVHLHSGEISTHVDESEARTMGFLVDLVTTNYGSNPAKPDSNGDIVREIAPDVMIRGTAAVESLLQAAHVQLVIE